MQEVQLPLSGDMPAAAPEEGRCLLSRDGDVLEADAAAARLLALEGVTAALAQRLAEADGLATFELVLPGDGRCLAVAGRPAGPAAFELRLREGGTDAARIQAERLDAAASAVGKLAHDVNNTLTVVLGNAEYLLESLADRPDLQEAARLVVAAAERGAELNRRVLLFSRRRGWQGAAVDPAEVLRELGARLAEEAPPGITIALSLPAALPAVALTAAALEEAISGLARNALEAMPDGGTLEISAAEDGRLVAITLRDTGRGMEPAELARSMEPFASRKPGGVGVGLGLAVAHGVARAAGGSLTLDSRPGEGTRAVLRVPVREG